MTEPHPSPWCQSGSSLGEPGLHHRLCVLTHVTLPVLETFLQESLYGVAELWAGVGAAYGAAFPPVFLILS